MAKLTKVEAAHHDQALERLSRGNLSEDDARFVFENFREDANHVNSKAGAFFTPYGLARDFRLHIPLDYHQHYKIIDLCAGIGVLSYAIAQMCDDRNGCSVDLTCVEINPEYVDLGKKLVPEATWICGDALDPALLEPLGHFDYAISNPPFGHIRTPHHKNYSSGQFEYMVIEAAAGIADQGIFIIPQMSAPFVYSGSSNARWLDGGRGRAFEKATGITLEFNIGVDTSQYKDGWHGVAPLCEIVCCDFTERTGQLSLAALCAAGVT